MRKLIPCLVVTLMVTIASCAAWEALTPAEKGAVVKSTGTAVASFLPPPFGALALVGVNVAGYFFANRKKNGVPPPPSGPRSSEFWMSMAVGTLALFSEKLGTHIPPEALIASAGATGTYAVGRSIVKAKKA